jgi:hypothetical protein
MEKAERLLMLRLLRFDKGPTIIFLESDTQLVSRVHHDWTVPGNWFTDRPSRKQQESDWIFFG